MNYPSYTFPVRSPEPEPGVAQILFVCHANQCRSPYAEALARQMMESHALRFSSGGLISGGARMPETGRALATQFGLDFSQHRSREIDLDDFSGFDLILTMARDQARELVAADAEVWPRIFTLKQFSRWIQDHPRPRRSAVGSWLDTAAADRPRTSVLGASDDDDVADPIGKPAEAWQRMIADLTSALHPIAAGLS